ncbi:MAG: lactoylglutathione lyase [Bacteroidales bacterium]|nr:lactoylglutathione lyase [Bacteroidales bacterium]
MKEIEFILYVANQERSTTFYHHLLKLVPISNVEGMTEFQLMPGVKLGLMPVKNVAKVLKSKMPHPSEGDGIPRCELYLKVTSAEKFLQRAIELGGELISEIEPRDWGDSVGYLADLDGHIIAIAER